MSLEPAFFQSLKCEVWPQYRIRLDTASRLSGFKPKDEKDPITALRKTLRIVNPSNLDVALEDWLSWVASATGDKR